MSTFESSFDEMVEKWPSTVVFRGEIGRFSGGSVAPGTVANADAQGSGPPGRFYVGRKAVYPVRELVEWLKQRATVDTAATMRAARGGRRRQGPDAASGSSD